MAVFAEIGELLNSGNLEKAYELIIGNESVLNGDPRYWNLRGLLCLLAEEYPAAISCLEIALSLDSWDSDSYYNYAYALERSGCLSDAALNYGLAFRYAPDGALREELMNIYADNATLRDIFEEAALGIQRRFIVLSSCGWGDVYQRMHHIARSLRRFGHEVFYLTPAVNVDAEQDLTISDLIGLSLRNAQIVDGVKVVVPYQAHGTEGRPISSYFDIVQNLVDTAPEQSKVVIVSYLPYQVDIIKRLEGDFVHIYECVDDHSDLEHAFWGTKKDILWEQELMDTADAITTTATALFLQRVVVENRDNVSLSRNAVNEADFILAAGPDKDFIPWDLVDIPKPRIVYTGVVYGRFDEELFYSVVESNPDKSFVIIGPVHPGMLSRSYPNLYLLGPKKHADLRYYLHNMQIGIVPYKDEADMDIACDSIKQYEYIACGLPVITTFMPESGMSKVYTYLANTTERFNKAINECLDLELDMSIVSEFLASNSWNARAALLCRLSGNSDIRDEFERSLMHVECALKELVANYDHPVFMTLYALFIKLVDQNRCQTMVRDAYARRPNCYIERMYLRSLLEGKELLTFVQVVSDSKLINKELKCEIAFRAEKGDWDSVEALGLIVVGGVREALSIVENLRNAELKEIYVAYLKYLLGEPFGLVHLSSQGQSPLYRYLGHSQMYNGHSVEYESQNDSRTFVADLFGTASEFFLERLSDNGIEWDGLCSTKSGIKLGKGIFLVDQLVRMQDYRMVRVIVPYDMDYVNQVRFLAEAGIFECYVAVVHDQDISMVYIDHELMHSIRAKDYFRTVSFSKFNAADSNIHALLRNMPEKYKRKYKVNVIYGTDVWSIDNIVKVPLTSSVTVSGFATFLYGYPKLTYNIEVGHGGLAIKACGLMDKGLKGSGGSPDLFEKVDSVCVASHLNMIVYSSFYAIPEDKYEITGLPRNDLLFSPDSKAKLEELLGTGVGDRRVVFNMPTFHVYEDLDRVEGSAYLSDGVKIADFDYDRFNEFLGRHGLICVSKVHHGEEKTVSRKTRIRSYDNLFFISNSDLEKHNVDLYEILGAGDILMTDYSTVYDDFLFMGKPTIFVTTDIDEYREKRGLALEPYDFWTAGPKVQTQDRLEEELLRCSSEPDYYESERERLLPVFFQYHDAGAVERTWEVIANAVRKAQDMLPSGLIVS